MTRRREDVEEIERSVERGIVISLREWLRAHAGDLHVVAMLAGAIVLAVVNASAHDVTSVVGLVEDLIVAEDFIQ